MTTSGAVLGTITRVALVVLALTALGAVPGRAWTPLDFVSFDGIDYIRWPEEPGRAAHPPISAPSSGLSECSISEDTRGCPYGMDAGAAFMPAGTPLYSVRGYATSFAWPRCGGTGSSSIRRGATRGRRWVPLSTTSPAR